MHRICNGCLQSEDRNHYQYEYVGILSTIITCYVVLSQIVHTIIIINNLIINNNVKFY
jgi:hypothetical protein